MADTFDILRKLALQVRNATLAGENSAERVGRILVGVLDLLSQFSLDELTKIFLRKDQPDQASFLVSFLAGAVFGKAGFASGLTGFGAKIDENGNGEMESLILRRFLEVPELRYNRISVTLGDKWNAPGAGIIEQIEPDMDGDGNLQMTGTGYLKLEEGEYGAIDVGDICMGIFHSEKAEDNATADSDDSCGNFQYAGFYTCYFTITEITGSNNKQFRYQLRPISERWKLTFHPCQAMHFVCYGSFTNADRQTSTYTTRTYTRRLWKQNTWEISAANIASQSGDLSNLAVHGLQMSGYSEYVNNVYLTGVIKQIKPDGTPVLTVNDRGAWTTGMKCDFYDRVSYDGRIWLCINEDGTSAMPSKDNVDWLLQVDKGADGTSFTIKDKLDDISQLPAEGNSIGDGYLIAGHLWVWNGQTFEDKGSIQGPAGQSVSVLGRWQTGMHVPYLGIVKMGTATWMCTVPAGTDNPPMWTITDKDGNRLLQTQDGGKTYGYILTGELNTAEYELVAQDGTNIKGDPGIQGCIIRKGEWKIGVEWRNDESLTSGTRYLDVALVRDGQVATGWKAYKCKTTHTSSLANAPGNSTYWEEFGLNTTAIFTSLIIAKDAQIDFMQGNQLLIKKDDGAVTAGLSGSQSGEKIRMWAGSPTPDNAPFRVTEGGKVHAENAEITGEVNATSGTFKNIKSPNNSFVIKENGDIEITGKVSTSVNGKRIVIDSATNSLRMYGSDDLLVGTMDFIDHDGGTYPRMQLTQYASGNPRYNVLIRPQLINVSENNGNDFYDVMINTSGITFLKNNVITKSYPNR